MRIIKSIKENGLIGTLRKGLRSFLGINKQQEAIDSLYYYLNNYIIDASTLPPAKDPDLRMMQLCDAALMNILDKIFKKHNLIYWLDFGTLLGAHRHKGLIPWDDDMDISMPREDYDKLLNILREELDTKVFDVSMENGRIGVGYMHHKTGIWCDVFPVDTYKATQEFEPAVSTLKDKIRKYRKYYTKNTNMAYSDMQRKRELLINDELGNNSYDIIYHGREFNHLHPKAFYLHNDVYPISKVAFEEYEFSAPANVPSYLERIFGKNYMQLPKGGILHHNAGRGDLSTWAKNSNVDMVQVLSYLKEYANRF